MKMTLNIEPKPQTRPRFSKFGTHEDPKMKAWRRQCSQLIEQEYDGQFFDGPIMVDVTFYMKAPLNVSKKPTPKARAKTWDAFKKFMNERLWHFRDWAFDKAQEVNSNSQLYKQAGNSVTVNVIKEIARYL